MTAGFSKRRIQTICFLAALCLFSRGIFAQENSGTQAVPDSLRRPERGEAPRYPNDLIIGGLGRGAAAEGAYLFAQRLGEALTRGNREAAVFEDSSSLFTESLFEEIQDITPRTFRLGGGRNETDGCVSFIIRFIGPEESITGELFIRRAEEGEPGGFGAEKWLSDDLLLESKRNNSEITDSYYYDFSPYERFY